MPRYYLFFWLAWAGWLTGCQSPGSARRITAANYLTAIPTPRSWAKPASATPAKNAATKEWEFYCDFD